MAIIGIDLGTTNSLGAVFRNDKVELIPNRFGSFLTPSVVSVLEDGSVIVGKIAKERLITHPDCTVASFKKEMGTETKFALQGKQFLPEELSSFVIRSIIEDAECYLGEKVTEAVISVPAYFHDRQRVATKRAGILAGIEVQRIINEPSAAALASYYDRNEEQFFLVFDFGGGTLDVSIIECFDTMVEILSVSGDNHLGGDNFHEVMLDNFLKEHHLSEQEITPTERAVILKQAELCKKALSEKDEAAMSAVLKGQVYQSIYTTERLMEESASILAKIKKVLTHALRDGNINVRDIHTVVMVGGSSKMPLIQSYIRHLFRQSPLITTNCDEMIARGVGLVCGVKERKSRIKDYILTDICPFTLGTNVHNSADPEHPYMSPIVERNTVLPCSRVKRFYTSRDNQTEIDLEILQGEHSYAEDNLCLAKMNIRIPKKKEGEESVDIRFTYDINGILIADITIVSSGQVITKVISETLDERELQQKITELEKLKVHPKDVSDNKYIMEKLQALYEESPSYLRDQIQNAIRYFDYLLAQQNPRPIRKYRNYLEQFIQQLESYDPFGEYFEPEAYEESDWDDDAFWKDKEDSEDADQEEEEHVWTN